MKALSILVIAALMASVQASACDLQPNGSTTAVAPHKQKDTVAFISGTRPQAVVKQVIGTTKAKK